MRKLIAISLLGLLAACASGPRIKDFVVYNDSKAAAIKVLELRELRESGLLKIQAKVRNTSNNEKISYRFNWYTQGGLAWNHESWKPMTLRKDQSDDIVGVAPSPDVTTYKLEFLSYE